MKNKLLLSFLFLMSVFVRSQVQLPNGLDGLTSENYIYSRSYLVPVSSSNASASQIQSITYFDGLGRPKQNIGIKASPTGEDLVTDIPYDGYGRQVDSWLPVPMSSLDGNIQSGVIGAATSFYSDPQNGFGDTDPSIHLKLEDSPLNKIEQRINPGGDWQSKPVNYTYDTNGMGEVKKFVTSTSWDNNATVSILKLSTESNDYVLNGYYKAGTLYKYMISDEDENVKIIYKNAIGQIILIRKINDDANIDTYYVYNEYNQLAYVIPPLAAPEINYPSGNLNEQSTIIRDLCYVYKYDARNRLVEKKLPGKGWDFMVYDLQDRLVMSQDAKMRENDQWLFTKYDLYGRTAYSGMAEGGDRIGEQMAVDAKGSNNVSRTTSATKYNGLNVYYTFSGTYPESSYITELYSVNYYDTYPKSTSPDGTTTSFPSRPNNIEGELTLADDLTNSSINTKGLSTADYVRNIADNRWTKTFVWYDQEARPIGSYNVNHLGGYTETKTILDFIGNPISTTINHKRRSTGELVTIKEDFTYDGQKRLLKHYHEVVGKSPKELLSENIYDRLGSIRSKKIGGEDNSSIQTVDYSYNIRGWLTGINKGNIDNLGDKLFAYEIKYQNPSNSSLAPEKFNGNISEVDWRMHGGTGKRRYGYRYDNLDRLLKASYQDPDDDIPETNIYNEAATYDTNGNIRSLKRFAKHGKHYTPVLIDDLEYHYDNNDLSNRLININDLSGNTLGYGGGNNLISYDDANGNMTIMPDKGISNISYNFLDLPTKIDKTNKTEYQYRADGEKIKKKFTLTNASGTTVINTEYIDGFQYSTPNTDPLRRAIEEQDPSTVQVAAASQIESFNLEERAALVGTGPVDQQDDNLILSFFPTSEGFYDYENYRYIYQYKDQVGNVRISYTRKSNGEIDIRDRNDYYPFGMNFPKNNQASIYDPLAIPYNYKFQQQELQETGFYSFKYRNYMPDVGRFFNVDPLSEKYAYQSHYNFSENRLIDAVELEGLEKIQLTPLGDFKSYSDAQSFANNTGGQVVLEQGEIPTVVHSIEQVNLIAHSSSNSSPQQSSQSSSSFSMGDAGHMALGFVPFVGSGLDIYEGARDGNYLQLSLGIAGLALDIATAGTGSLAVGSVKAGVKTLAKEGVELAVKEAGKDIAESAGKNLALGLGDDLFNFAEKNGYDTYKNFSTGFQKDKILDAMNSYDKIHFNTTGFGKINFSKFDPTAPLTYHNYTNWEMHTIMSNPSLLKKTTFYNKSDGAYNILHTYTPFIK